MKSFTKLFSSFFAKNTILTNCHFIAFLLIFCLAVPIVFTFVTWFAGRLERFQFGRALGTTSQMMVGCVGNAIHEMENIIVARLGGHRISGVHFNTAYCYRHFGYMGEADHNWQSSGIYQSLLDIFLGVMPIYLTTLLLWGIQSLLGQNNYNPISISSLSWSSLWTLKSALTHGFNTAFSTGNFITDIIYAFIVLIVASTAYSISSDELKRTQNGLVFWVPLLIIISLIIAFFGKAEVVLPYLWQFGYFSAFGLGRVMAYLIVIIITMVIFALINYFFSDIKKLFTRRKA